MKRDASGNRTVEVSVELPCTPEEIWETIATGPGVAAWFMPMQIKEGVGDIVMDSPEGPQVIGKTTVWDPPHRMVGEGPMFGPGGPPVGTEWHIEARAGGKCVVRVVHSLFADTDDWDDELKSVESGWPRFFRVLRLFTERFLDTKTAMPIQVMRPVGVDEQTAWNELTRALGVSDLAVGESFSSPPGAPDFGGTVAQRMETTPSHGLLALDTPCEGIVSPAVFAVQGQVVAHLSLYLYGDEAPELAARDTAAWQSWLEGLGSLDGA